MSLKQQRLIAVTGDSSFITNAVLLALDDESIRFVIVDIETDAKSLTAGILSKPTETLIVQHDYSWYRKIKPGKKRW